jgi:PIN domain nuclease of toxin-antitoxin system
VKLLLDTHAFLWFVGGDPRLSAAARLAIEDAANLRLFSTAAAWEIALKVSLGKLLLHAPFEDLIPDQLQANGIELLPIEPEHLREIIDLPFHHRDPFDRLLVAQSRREGATLVSADRGLDAYQVERLW